MSKRVFHSVKIRVLPTEEWMNHGACREVPLDIFFPRDGPPSYYASAKAICNSCIHQTECLEYALKYRLDDGIWGGATRNERRRILRSRGLRVYSRSERLELPVPSLASSVHG